MAKADRDRASSMADSPQRGKLGTFAGVFTPSILTILGLILFLKMGYVVGAAGLPRALAIILLANAISIVTSISLSAIATNLRVKGGGDYYVISRTLGVQYGGALGVVLFLAQSVSIGFYAIGFGEGLSTVLRAEANWAPQAIAAAAVAGLFVLAWSGADWATRFQYLVMVVLFAGIIAFYAGALPAWETDQLRASLTADGGVPFWVLFALFFPAVTGFTQGVSMSGDLKAPGKSIPRGTFLAVGISLVVYLSIAVVFAAAAPGSQLMADDTRAMRNLALLPGLVDAGAIAATLSSALASFLGAPRILQSLAGDHVFRFLNPFAVGHGPTANPRRGVLLSAVIAFGTIGLGNLETVAPVVSMFFLISYGLLNHATFVEARANSPSFRPRFRFFHGTLSLAGSVGCLGAMLAISPTAGAIAVAVLFALHQYVSRTVDVLRWADSDRSRRFQRVREDLLAISAEPEHPRYWRPVLLAFSDNPERRERILRFASWLEGRSGLTTAVRVIEGDGPRARRLRAEGLKELTDEIGRHELPAFARVIVAPDPETAVPVLLQSHGLGPVRANTALFNWFDRSSEYGAPGLRHYGRYLRLALRFECNLVLLGADADDFSRVVGLSPRERRIDVWYRDNATGRLSLLLAYLMTRTERWDDARIRLLAPAPEHGSRDEALEKLERMLEDVRIPATAHIVEGPADEAVVRESAAAPVVFLPFRIGEEGPTSAAGGPLDGLIRKLGVTALVLASQDIELDAEPEGGRYGEIAEAVDAADRAEKTARRVEKKAAGSADAARKTQEELELATVEGAKTEDVAALVDKSKEARGEAERSRRRAAKARVKADEATREAGELKGEPPPSQTDETS